MLQIRYRIPCIRHLTLYAGQIRTFFKILFVNTEVERLQTHGIIGYALVTSIEILKHSDLRNCQQDNMARSSKTVTFCFIAY